MSTEAACRKLFASEMCGRVADRAVQLFGGAGHIADYGIVRFYRDVRLFRLYEGTSQIQQTVIARIEACVLAGRLEEAKRYRNKTRERGGVTVALALTCSKIGCGWRD